MGFRTIPPQRRVKPNLLAKSPREASEHAARTEQLDYHSSLEWNYAAHSRSVHKPALRQVIVLDRPVLHRAVVPHQKVPDPPLVTIDEGRLNNVIGKCVDQRLGFPSLYSLDPGAIVAQDIEAFAPGVGMGPDDRMGDRRVAIYFRLSGRNGPLAPSKVKHRAAPVGRYFGCPSAG